MIPLSSSCAKLVYVLVLSRATRSLFWTLRSERCVRRPNYGNRALLSERAPWSGGGPVERSDPKIGWSGAERWAGVAEKRWSGVSRNGNGAGSGGYRIRLERGAAFSPAPLTCSALNTTVETRVHMWQWIVVISFVNELVLHQTLTLETLSVPEINFKVNQQDQCNASCGNCYTLCEYKAVDISHGWQLWDSVSGHVASDDIYTALRLFYLLLYVGG